MIEFEEDLRIADARPRCLEMIERGAEVPRQIGRLGGVQEAASLQLSVGGQARRQLKARAAVSCARAASHAPPPRIVL